MDKEDNNGIEDGLKYLLEWVDKNKVYTIILIILLSLGATRIVKYFKKSY